MTTTTASNSSRARVGERVELARYHISGGERVLHGQRINGVVRVTDTPATAGGRAYVVERELEHDGYAALQAVIADYLAQSQRRDEPAILVNLDQLAARL